MPRTAPTISDPNRMFRVSIDVEQQVDAGLVVDAGVEEDVAHTFVSTGGCFSMSASPRYRPQW